jgi:hypothetical protein
MSSKLRRVIEMSLLLLMVSRYDILAEPPGLVFIISQQLPLLSNVPHQRRMFCVLLRQDRARCYMSTALTSKAKIQQPMFRDADVLGWRKIERSICFEPRTCTTLCISDFLKDFASESSCSFLKDNSHVSMSHCKLALDSKVETVDVHRKVPYHVDMRQVWTA